MNTNNCKTRFLEKSSNIKQQYNMVENFSLVK